MERSKRLTISSAMAVVFGITGCAFVEVDDSAVGVEVRKTEAEVAECKRVGTVEAQTQAKVGFVARGETTVAVELERLARNRAARTGANTIVPLGPVDDEGRRAYASYLCADE